jgi:hypothetical protein
LKNKISNQEEKYLPSAIFLEAATLSEIIHSPIGNISKLRDKNVLVNRLVKLGT